MDMEDITPAMIRLDEWLLRHKALPADARQCIENFVLSCDRPDGDDELNFTAIDIADFHPDVQARLVEGFRYAYYGISGQTVVATESAFYPVSNN